MPRTRRRSLSRVGPARKVTLMSTSAQANENARAVRRRSGGSRRGKASADSVSLKMPPRERPKRQAPFAPRPYFATERTIQEASGGRGANVFAPAPGRPKIVLLTDVLAGLKTGARPLHQDGTPRRPCASQDRHLLGHSPTMAFSDLLRPFLDRDGAPFRRYVDGRNSECLALHHGRGTVSRCSHAFRFPSSRHGHSAAAAQRRLTDQD